MTIEEANAFKGEFQSIVAKRVEVKGIARQLGLCEAWNRGGSHDKAIERAKQKLDESNQELKEKLKGKKYSDWQEFGRRLTKIRQQLKSKSRKEFAELELSKLKF